MKEWLAIIAFGLIVIAWVALLALAVSAPLILVVWLILHFIV